MLALSAQAMFDVAWTRDGKIIFPTKDSIKTDIWMIDGDGADKRQLTAGDALERSPETSPDGRFIVYVSTQNGQQNIWRMDADGSNQIALTNGEGESFPVFTPDGKWVVYTSSKTGVYGACLLKAARRSSFPPTAIAARQSRPTEKGSRTSGA